jgi:integrase/recombinase XerD
MAKIEIHDFSARLGRVEASLENPLSPHNVDLIRQFEKSLFSEGIGLARITKYLGMLKQLAEMLDKDFDTVTRYDLEDVVYRIERSEYSPWTKSDYKVTLKRFYKWLKGNNELYPDEVKWITTTLKTKNRLLPENLLTEDDIQRLIDTVDRPRDKAFIITLYESGARIGELGSLRLS